MSTQVATTTTGTSPRPPAPTPTPDPRALMWKAYQEAGPKWERVVRLFERWLDEDHALYRALLEPLKQQAMWDLCRSIAHSERASALGGRLEPGPTPAPRNGNGALVREARQRLVKLMDMPLDGGVRLGEATAELVEMIAERYIKTGATNYEIGLFLRQVRRALPDDKATVRKTLTEQKLQLMRERAAKIAKDKF